MTAYLLHLSVALNLIFTWFVLYPRIKHKIRDIRESWMIRGWVDWSFRLTLQYGWTATDASLVLYHLSEMPKDKLLHLTQSRPKNEETALLLLWDSKGRIQTHYQACFSSEDSEVLVKEVENRVRMKAFREDYPVLRPDMVGAIIEEVHQEAHLERAEDLPENVREILEKMGVDLAKTVVKELH